MTWVQRRSTASVHSNAGLTTILVRMDRNRSRSRDGTHSFTLRQASLIDQVLLPLISQLEATEDSPSSRLSIIHHIYTGDQRG